MVGSWSQMKLLCTQEMENQNVKGQNPHPWLSPFGAEHAANMTL